MIGKLMNDFGVAEAYIGLVDPLIDNGSELLDASRFQWIDGSDFIFGSEGGSFPWLGGFPKNEGSDLGNGVITEADCTKIVELNGDFFWKDVDCELTFLVVCRTFCSVSAFELENSSGTDQIIFIGAGVAGLVALVGLIVGLVLRNNEKTQKQNDQILNNLDHKIDPTKHLNEQIYGNSNRPSGLGMSVRSALSKISFRSSQSSLNPPLADSNPLAKRMKELERNKKQVRETGATPHDFVEGNPEEML